MNTHALTWSRTCSPSLMSLSVDDGSDWSTLTAESGEDTPSWPFTMETEECEVVRCVCEVDEENDFMIQVKHRFTPPQDQLL